MFPVPISRLMALAIRFEQLIRDGTVHDQADLARLAHVSRARVTQIMDLLLLAPKIQEEILFLSPVERGKDRITERHMRSISSGLVWEYQRHQWKLTIVNEGNHSLDPPLIANTSQSVSPS